MHQQIHMILAWWQCFGYETMTRGRTRCTSAHKIGERSSSFLFPNTSFLFPAFSTFYIRPSMSTLTLPQDVADEIIDAASLVDESYTILFNMSLVSKSFASGSQAHLFRTVKIWNATRCAELLDIIKHSPSLAPRIRTLEIHEMTDVNWLPVSYYQSGDHWIHSPESGELLDRLTSVEFIVLRNKRLDRTEVDRLVRCSLRGRLQSVIGLQLSNVHDLELDGLAHLLLHFPRLETLDTFLTDIALVPSPHSETDSESVSPNRWIIRYLKLPGPPCFRRMTLYSRAIRPRHAASVLVRELGSAQEHSRPLPPCARFGSPIQVLVGSRPECRIRSQIAESRHAPSSSCSSGWWRIGSAIFRDTPRSPAHATRAYRRTVQGEPILDDRHPVRYRPIHSAARNTLGRYADLLLRPRRVQYGLVGATERDSGTRISRSREHQNQHRVWCRG
jgi:hypothetical protein